MYQRNLINYNIHQMNQSIKWYLSLYKNFMIKNLMILLIELYIKYLFINK